MKLTLTFAGLFFVSSSAFGVSSFVPKAPVLKDATRASEACPNFSGSWEGVCKVEMNGSTMEDASAYLIEQVDCDLVSFDEQDAAQVPGKIVSENHGNLFQSTRATRLEWSADRAELIANVDIRHKDNEGTSFETAGAITHKLNAEGKLLVDSKFDINYNGQAIKQVSSCVYTQTATSK